MGILAFLCRPEVATMQWAHSIQWDPSYTSPWQASEDALELAFMLHPTSFQQTWTCRDWGLSLPRPRRRQNFHVAFAQEVEIYTGDDDSPFWTAHKVPAVGVSPREVQTKLCTFSQSFCIDNLDDGSFDSFATTSSTTQRGEVPVLQAHIMDEFVNLPHIPDDDADAHFPGHLPLGQQPQHRPDFPDSMIAQMDPSMLTHANLMRGAHMVHPSCDACEK